MANEVNFSGQGDVMFAEVRNGVPVGGYRKVGTADKFEITIDQTFDDIYETSTGNSLVEDHVSTKSTTKVMINMKKWSIANLMSALYGSSAGAQVAGTVTAEVFKAYPDSWAVLKNHQVSAVVLTVGGTPLVQGTDYIVEPRNGAIQFLPGSTVIDDEDGVDVSAAYSYAAIAGKVEAFTGGMKEYAIRLHGINRVDPTAPVIVDLYRVSLDLTKQISLIDEKHSSLPINGMLLQDVTRPVGTSQFFTITKS